MAGVADPGQDSRNAGRAQRTADLAQTVDAAIDTRVNELVAEHNQTVPLTDEQIHAVVRVFTTAAAFRRTDAA